MVVGKARSVSHLSNPENNKDAIDLIKGLLFNFLGALMKLGKVLFIIVAAKYYGATALGLYFLAWSATDIASKLGLWGMDKCLIRDIARFNAEHTEESNQRILSIMYFSIRFSLFFSVVAMGIVYWSAPWIADVVFKDASLITPLRILSPAIPFIVLTQALIAATKALRLMQYEVYIRQGFEPAVLLALTIALIPFGLGAAGLAAAHLMASIAASVAAFFVVWWKYKYLSWPPLQLSKQRKNETLRYTSPIAAMDLLNLSVARADIMMVGALMNSTSAGLYGIVVEIISVIKRVRQGLEPIFSPIVSELFHNRQKQRLRRNYVLVTRWLLAGSLLPVIAMLLFPEQILSFFDIHSPKAVSALMVLALAHGLFGAFSASESLLVMTGRTLLNAGLGALMLLVNVVTGLLLIPILGLLGAAAGTLAAFFVVSFARIYYAYKKLHLLPFGFPLLWPVVTATLAAIFFYFIKTQLNVETFFETMGLFSVMLLFYAFIYFWGAREPEEKFLLDKFKSKFNRSR